MLEKIGKSLEMLEQIGNVGTNGKKPENVGRNVGTNWKHSLEVSGWLGGVSERRGCPEHAGLNLAQVQGAGRGAWPSFRAQGRGVAQFPSTGAGHGPCPEHGGLNLAQVQGAGHGALPSFRAQERGMAHAPSTGV